MNHQNNCRHFLESLSEYVDGTLNQELCDEIERHLAGCEDCRVVIDTLKKTIYLYHETAASPSIPSNVRARLFKRLNLEEYLDNPVNL